MIVLSLGAGMVYPAFGIVYGKNPIFLHESPESLTLHSTM